MPVLHVNVDHVATLRQARRETFPDPVAWAREAESAGARGITCHLRQDRRHVNDDDVLRLREATKGTFNLELSLAPEIVAIAEKSGADAFCLVPEDRAEVTTEGGLDLASEKERVAAVLPRLTDAGGLVSLFLDPDERQLELAAEVGAPFVELHTGRYANAEGDARERELERIRRAVARGRELGLRMNAGHGLDYENVHAVHGIPGLEELNIGFAIVARSLFVGAHLAVVEMRARMLHGVPGG